MLKTVYLKSFIYYSLLGCLIFGIMHFISLNYIIGIDGQKVRSSKYKLFIVQKTNFIAFRTDERMTRYFKPGSIFVKKIVGYPGDVVNTIGDKFYVNGKFVGEAVKYDLDGKPIKHKVYHNYRLSDNEYFVMGTNKFSYDSRYWGTVKENQIIGKALPVF